MAEENFSNKHGFEKKKKRKRREGGGGGSGNGIESGIEEPFVTFSFDKRKRRKR